MADDREMLELAALAMGLYADGYRAQYREGEGWVCVRPADESCPFQSVWAPLTDDGDCARMEAALRIDVVWEIDAVCAWTSGDWGMREQCGDDRQAARRLASTRAAAEHGRRMKEAGHD